MWGTKESEYNSSLGKTIPVYSDYRFAIKEGWKYFGPLSFLEELKCAGLLSDSDAKLYSKFVGSRTLNVSIEEVRELCRKYVDKHHALLYDKKISNLGKRWLIPEKDELAKKVAAKADSHASVIQNYIDDSELRKGNGRVLEIGYTSGGLSQIGFEKLGFDVCGLDYFFDGKVPESGRHVINKRILNSNVEYHAGDITRRTSFDDESFDIVYSLSTIEHISNLGSAFEEMFRLLKPGGFVLHSYDPYFHPVGGHSLGILDSPWAHVRVSKEELINYLHQYRPLEAKIAAKWINAALHPEHTLAAVQHAVNRSGFEFTAWSNTPVKDEWLTHLNSDIVSDCLTIYETATIQDLMTRGVCFCARKPPKS
jgi:SAM-dependent methyltransferase